MISPLAKVLLACGSAVVVAGVALTITPAYHNYGEVGVMGLKVQTFRITLPPGSPRGIMLGYRIVGPDSLDFLMRGSQTIDPFDPNTSCGTGPQGVACTEEVEFRPRSPGPKKATLVAGDDRGSFTSATLEGKGVAPVCTHTVVPCNYALHYSGVVSYAGENGHVNVDVVEGVASCNAADSEQGGITSGPGIIGVEIERNEDRQLRRTFTYYVITVACPIRYPPQPVRRAELGHMEFGSYKQPLGMALGEAIAAPPRLKGQNNEGDELVSWNLCPNSQYRPAPRERLETEHDPCP